MSERNFLIGTAGHVDHGKSKLIEALTGIETDRLKEEKERGISIELGFAFLTLPNGKKAGIVDVPGHEKFVRQMLAGASGMDIVLMVIAADEGVMPQTIEHLNILNLLQINKGIVVLTKTDLVDAEWLSMIEQDTKEKLKGSFLENAPYCKVSSFTKEGIVGLLQSIVATLGKVESRKTNLPARMPIDRVFTIQGFGTVVTGTLSTGIFYKGQEVILEPGSLVTKVRNIQVHGDSLKEVSAGQRAAINLSGLAVNDIERGATLVVPGHFKTGQIIDVELNNLPSEKRPIRQRQRVHFHVGTAEILGRVHLLEQEEISPGERGFAQIILEENVLVMAGDRFVIRYYSPVTTIGGGKVLGLSSVKRKRFKDYVLEELRIKADGNIYELLIKELEIPLSLKELIDRAGMSKDEVKGILESLLDQELLVEISDEDSGIYWLKEAAHKWGEKAFNEVVEFQKRNPLYSGIGREDLKRKLGIESQKKWLALLEWGATNKYFRLKGNNIQALTEIKIPDKIKTQIDYLIGQWKAAGLNPPAIAEGTITSGIAADRIQEFASYLVDQGKWVRINDYYFSSESIEMANNILINLLKDRKRISASEARDLWQTSRKYAIPLLEYFDSIHVTKRDGVTRILYKVDETTDYDEY